MVMVKTADLIGAALDWAVAKAEGVSIRVLSADNPGEQWQVQRQWRCDGPYWPSQDWDQGGPLIDAHEIWLAGPAYYRTGWDASLGLSSEKSNGPTPLIAACRCIVCAGFGDIVEIPAELAPNENP